MRIRTIVLLATLAAPALAAQTVLPGAAFEVASIRQNTSGDENFGFTPQPGGVMAATNVTARQIVTYAYSMQNSRVEGGPEWLDTMRFDITAKAAAAATPEQMLLMLRTLLADRFGLVVRLEARPTPVFALVLARSDGRLGSQVRPSTVDCAAVRAAIARGQASQVGADGRPVCGGRARPGLITVGAVSMEELARNMSRLVQRPVVDRTGLQGRFDFELKYAPDAELTAVPPDRLPELPSLFVALEEQLGLKLESTRAPIDVAVIDSIRPPVAN